MRKTVLAIFSFAACISTQAVQAADYPVSAISKSLTANANAVVRLHEQTVEIHSLNKVTIKEHYVITILNEAADHLAAWSSGYSSIISISGIDGTLYDATGKKIRSLKKSEIIDRSRLEYGFEVNDDRIKYHSFNYKEYPFTVEYESEETRSYTMFLPGWRPVLGKGVAIEKSTFKLISDKDFSYRVRPSLLKTEPSTEIDGKKKVVKWELLQHPAVVSEYASPGIYQVTPTVTLAPDEFKLGDYKGSMSTWQDFAKFTGELIAGRDELPQSFKEKVHGLISNAKSDKEKVEILYKYLQKNTHYISIQLGIGGWQPLTAKFVTEKGYGDCKALTNLMIALLKEAGIKSNYVLIRSGADENDINTSFPASYFNHVICAVPMTSDTVWLECTSQVKDPGYMGSFTGNRHALMVTDGGGKIVRTPYYNKQDNSIKSVIYATLDVGGKLDINVTNRYQACETDYLQERIHSNSKEEQLKILKKSIDIPHYDVNDFSYQEIPGKLPVILEKMKITAPGYAQVTGKRVFVIPNIINKWDTKLQTDTARVNEIDLREEKIETDTVHIEIPAGYATENLPKPMDIKTPFGWYQSSASITGNKLVYIRRLEINKGRFPAKDYQSLVKFYEDIYKADRAKVVLVKSE